MGIILLRIDGHEVLASAMVAASRWLNALDKDDLVATSGSNPGIESEFLKRHPHIRLKMPLTHLVKLPWFQRIWVIQEATPSRYLLVQLGDETLSWDAFASAALLFVGHGNVWRRKTPSRGVLPGVPEAGITNKCLGQRDTDGIRNGLNCEPQGVAK
jgi:hypothetical protein